MATLNNLKERHFFDYLSCLEANQSTEWWRRWTFGSVYGRLPCFSLNQEPCFGVAVERICPTGAILQTVLLRRCLRRFESSAAGLWPPLLKT